MPYPNDTFKKDLGNRLKELRKNAGLSQKEVATQANLNATNFARWERGEILLDTDNLMRIAEFFNVTTDYILYGKELSDDNSFTWYDNFKRLNRLYDTMEIKRIRSIENPSDVYLKLSDNEAKEWFGRVERFEENKRYKMSNGKEELTTVKDLDALFDDFREDKTQLLSREEKQRRQWAALNAIKPILTARRVKEDNDEITITMTIPKNT